MISSLKKFVYLFTFFLSFSIVQADMIDSRYHSYEEIVAMIDSLDEIEAYDDLLMVDTIGYSSQDNIPIVAVKISDNVRVKEDEPRMLFVGQVHAEEILGIEIVLDLMMDLLDPRPEDFNHMNILRSYLEIWIIPTGNPEGLAVVHDGLDLTYRKNKRDFSHNSTSPNGVFDFEPSIGNDVDGVDLNRNFSFNWTFGDTFLVFDETDYGSHYDYFRGTDPFSESEAIAIRDLALENDFTFSIVWHSSRSGRLSEKIFTSWRWEDAKPAPDALMMKGIADSFAELLETEDGTGNYLSVFSGSRNGKLHDWFYRETGCIQYLIECGTSNLQPDSALIENTIQRTKPAMIYLMDRTIGYNTNAGQITGIVYDASTNSPLSEAIVEIKEHSGSVLKPRKTNEFGRFRRILDAGTYNINVSKKGYLPLSSISVANNSAITNVNFSLEPAPLHTIGFEFFGVEELDQIKIQITSEFDTIQIPYGLPGYWELHEGFYTIDITGIDIPWTKSFYLDENKFFSIPVNNSMSINLVNNWNWNVMEGDWYTDENNNLRSQQGKYYSNNDSTLLSQWMETDFIDLVGMNRIVLSIQHQYETEWDHDSVGISLINGDNVTIFKHGWSGDRWIDSENRNLVSVSDPLGFDLVKVRLWFKRDMTVNYRGWAVNDLSLHAINDAYLGSTADLTNVTPKIKFGVKNIFPNPSNGRIQMDISSWQGGSAKISLFNILGQKIMTKNINIDRKGDQFINLDFSNFSKGLLSSGMVFVSIESFNHKVVRKCVILKN